MGIGRSFFSSIAAFGVLLLSPPFAYLLSRPIQAQQPPAPQADAATGKTHPDCGPAEHSPELKPRPSQTRAYVCSWRTGPSTLEISTAPHRPFTAEETLLLWRAWPRDRKQRRELKHELVGWKLSHDHTRLTSSPIPYSIARDGEGRILRSLWSGQDFAQDLVYQQKMLCDPATETETDFSGTDGIPIHPLADGQVLEKPDVQYLPWHSHAYNPMRWRAGSREGDVVDLGYREIEGIRAHGRRWLLAHDSSFSDGDFRELWVSEDLQADVLYIEQNLTEGKGMRAELTHVRLAEPDPKLFQMPKGHPAVVRESSSTPQPCPASP